MFDEILEVFDRDGRRDGRRRSGLGGLIDRLTGRNRHGSARDQHGDRGTRRCDDRYSDRSRAWDDDDDADEREERGRRRRDRLPDFD